MKPLKAPAFFVKTLLLGLSTTLIVFGFLLMQKTMPFFPSVQTTFTEGDINVHVAQGLMPFHHSGTFLGIMFLWLVFEFYGFKSAFYAVITTTLMTAGVYGLFEVLDRYLLMPDTNQYDYVLSQLISHRFSDLIAYIGPYLLAFSAMFLIGATIKRITRNYFMFIRYPIAATIGFAGFVFLEIYLKKFQLLAPVSMLYEAITPFSHFFALIIASVVPLYLLRLSLGLFRGWYKDDTDEVKSKKGLFKGKESKEIPAQPEVPEVEEDTAPGLKNDDKQQIVSLPKMDPSVVMARAENEDSAETKEDPTVSKKIKLNTSTALNQ